MGIVEFFILCVILVLLAALAVWAMGYFAPNHPPIIDKIIWGVVIVLIIVVLVRATGLLNYDPPIPRIR